MLTKTAGEDYRLRLDQAYRGLVVWDGGGHKRADEQKGVTAGLVCVGARTDLGRAKLTGGRGSAFCKKYINKILFNM